MVQPLPGQRVEAAGRPSDRHGRNFLRANAETTWALHTHEVDCIVRGDGEQTLAGLLAAGLQPENVPGLTYRKDGGLMENPADVEENLDLFGIRFLRSGLGGLYSPRPVVPVATSRGLLATLLLLRALQVGRPDLPPTQHRQIVDELKQHVDRGVQRFGAGG